MTADVSLMSDLLTDDLVHVHANGLVENKAAYIASLLSRLQFLKVDRGELTVRRFDNVAVMTGSIDQIVAYRDSGEERRICAVVTQIWLKHGSGWRLASFQATRTS